MCAEVGKKEFSFFADDFSSVNGSNKDTRVV